MSNRNLTLAEAAKYLKRFLRDMEPYSITWGEIYRNSPDQAGLTRLRNIRAKLDSNINRCLQWVLHYGPSPMEEFMVTKLKEQSDQMIAGVNEAIAYVEETIRIEEDIQKRLDRYERGSDDHTQVEMPF